MFGLTYYQFSALFNSVSALLIAIFVLLKNRKSVVNITFFLFGAAVSFWAFNYFLWQNSKDYQTALFYCRGLTLGSTTFPIFYFHFVIAFLHKRKQKAGLLYLGYFLWAVFMIFTFTPLMVKGCTRISIFPFWPIPGPLYIFYLIYFQGYSLYAIYLMFLRYRQSTSSFEKNQIRWMWMAMIIGLIGGSSNYFLWWKIMIPPVGNILVSLYPLLMGYAIIRYKALEIDTVFHKTTLWVLSILVFILPLSLPFGLLKEHLLGLGLVGVAGLISLILIIFLLYYNRMKPFIDQFFRRRKYDYQLLLAEMPARIGSSLDLELLSRNLFHELRETLYVRNALLIVKIPEKRMYELFSHSGFEGLMQAGAGRITTLRFEEEHALVSWLRAEQKAVEKEQVEIDPRYQPIKEPALALFRKYSLEILLPVTMLGELVAILGLGKKENLQSYRLKDIELLEHIGSQIGITIDNALHHQDIVEKERIAEELRLGKQIQISLLPPSFPDVPFLSIGGTMYPAQEIGGDYYDFITLPDRNKLGIVIGDGSGKGVAAGLLMAMAKTAIHIYSVREESPRKTLMFINDIFSKQIGGDRFMTMLYLVWQPNNSLITYSSAGHEDMLVYRHSLKQIEVVESGGIMLGVVPDVSQYLKEMNIKLNVHDKILLYTDGITEAMNNSRERFGLERLKTTFQKHSQKPVKELMAAIKDEIFGFMGSFPQYDDITMVVLEACEKDRS